MKLKLVMMTLLSTSLRGTVRVIGNVPVAVVAPAVRVRVTEHDGLAWNDARVHDVGEKLGVAPIGSPENEAVA